jgi:formylglycine-generating enzyme required for sulfatase activity
LSVNEIAQATVNAFATEQAIRDADATSSADILTLQAGQTADAIEVETRVAVLQATQTTWTPTATTAPSDTPTVTLTNTHIPTATPSDTPTLTPTNTPTPTSTPSSTPTATPTLSPLEVAQAGVTQNTNWTPLSQHFGGVEMVLVPAGCFMMGSETGSDEERPVHEQCFDSPFWIDRYEVTNAQFNASGSYGGPDQPRETINWFGAVRHCEGQRSARLPTEAEWEYAARGPDNLDYAWGNDFDANRVVYDENSGDQTANVGSHLDNASWVGALDMNGNVFEWVSGRFENYPYRSDSRENFDESNSARTIRGGSWGNTALELRNSYRYGLDPYAQSNFGGFRCARDFAP